MKKIIFTALTLSYLSICLTAVAQPDKPEKTEKQEKREKPERKEQQEITIRSKGDKNVTLKVEINGDNILINGKTLLEFKDDNITINKRKMIYRDDDGNMNFNFDAEGMKGLEELQKLQSFHFDDANIGFNNAYKDFKNSGRNLPRPFLGVTTEKTVSGAKVVDVVKGSAAEKAGLKNDDIVTKIDKQIVTGADGLAKIISDKKPKDEIKIFYKREGKNKDVKVVLGETGGNKMHFNFNAPNAMARGFKMPPRADIASNGNIDMENLDPFQGFDKMFPHQKKLGLKIQDTEEGGNVKVIDVEDSSAAQKAGLQKGDLITEINERKVENTDDARAELQEASAESAYKIKAKRNGTEMTFDIKFPKKLKTANL